MVKVARDARWCIECRGEGIHIREDLTRVERGKRGDIGGWRIILGTGRLGADHLCPAKGRAGQVPLHGRGVQVPRRAMQNGAHLIGQWCVQAMRLTRGTHKTEGIRVRGRLFDPGRRLQGAWLGVIDKALWGERRSNRKLGKDMGEIIAKFSNELLVRLLRSFPEEVLLSRRQGESRSRYARIQITSCQTFFPLLRVPSLS